MKNDPPSIPIRNAKDGNSVCPPWPSLLGVVMMTEDEAKQKWCPHARVGVRDYNGEWTGTNHNMAVYLDNDADNMDGDRQKCIGSACMAWRWDRPDETLEKHVYSPTADKEQGLESQGWTKTSTHTSSGKTVWERVKTGRGYCGLAGEPK